MADLAMALNDIAGAIIALVALFAAFRFLVHVLRNFNND